MIKQLAIIAILCSLIGCAGSKATTSVTALYKTSSGAIAEVTKTATIESKSDTANPPEVNLDEIRMTPVDTGIVTKTDSNGIATTQPSIEIKVDTGNVNATGNFLSAAEAALPLLKTPMIMGGILLVAGIVLFFLPFPLPILKRVGIATAVAGIILMGVAYGLASTPPLLLWGTGVVFLLGVVGFVLWYMLKQGKAIKENVQTVEYIKNNVLTDEQKARHFDGPTAPVPMIQSPSTRSLVSQFRVQEGFKEK